MQNSTGYGVGQADIAVRNDVFSIFGTLRIPLVKYQQCMFYPIQCYTVQYDDWVFPISELRSQGKSAQCILVCQAKDADINTCSLFMDCSVWYTPLEACGCERGTEFLKQDAAPH